MLKSSIGAACATVLVALAGGLAMPTASHAADYGGVFDPENANYKWFGNHVFTVADSCLDGDGWKKVNAIGNGGCGSAALKGGNLTVINKLGTVGTGDDVSKTLQFVDFGFIPNTVDVWGVNIVGGELVGVDTFEIGDFVFVAPGTTHLGDWTLEWSSGQGAFCDLYGGCPQALPGGPNVANALPNSATVTLRNFSDSFPNGNPNLPGPSTEVTFERVPEPATVTLVLAALGATWLTRRRRRQ